jgi:hypothetical protein
MEGLENRQAVGGSGWEKENALSGFRPALFLPGWLALTVAASCTLSDNHELHSFRY